MSDDLITDARYALRRLVRFSGSSVFAVMALALAMTANTTVLSLLNATSLRRVDVGNPRELIKIQPIDLKSSRPGFVYQPTASALNESALFLSRASMYVTPFVLRADIRGVTRDVSMEAGGEGFFELLQVRLTLGRDFTPVDAGASTQQLTAIISSAIWQRLFANDPSVIGQTLLIENKPVTIIGVAPAEFGGLSGDTVTDIWVPVATARTLISDSSAPVRSSQLVARLARGTTLDRAHSELLNRWPAIQNASTQTLPASLRQAAQAQTIEVTSAARGFSLLRTQYERPVVALFVLTMLFLAIASVNLAGLITTRSIAERLQTAVKVALGASRARLIRQAAVEGLFVAFSALILTIPATWWLCQQLTTAVSSTRSMPLQPGLAPDELVLASSIALAAVIGVGVFVIPAWRVSANGYQEVIRGTRSAGHLNRSAKIAIVAQIALSMTLVVGGSLFARTFDVLENNQRRFRDQDILFTRLPRTPGDRTRLEGPYFQQLVTKLAMLQGVRSAALSTSFPGFLGSKTPLPTEVYLGPANGNDPQIAALTEFVSPGFFTTFDITLRLGRDFDWDDGVGRQAVAIVNQRLAATLFPNGDPIGQFIRSGGPTPSTFEIVGVVETTTIGSLREPDLPVVFRAVQQNLTRAQVPIAHVRVEPGSADSVRETYARAVAEEGHHYVRSLLTFDQFMNNALIQERLLFAVTSAIAIVGVLLACWGVYAALAYSMAIRTREIAIRMAIGASPKAVLRGVLVDGMTLAGTGVIIGVPVALAVATMVRSQLFGVSATDPAILVSVATGFLIIVLVAVAVPARRAARTDPSNALRT